MCVFEVFKGHIYLGWKLHSNTKLIQLFCLYKDLTLCILYMFTFLAQILITLLFRVVSNTRPWFSVNSDSIELNLQIQSEIILDLNIPSKKHKQV